MTITSDKPAPAKVGPGRAEQCALSGYYIAFSILLLRAEISVLELVLFVKTFISKGMGTIDFYLFVTKCFFLCHCLILAWEQQYSSPVMKIMCYKVPKVSPVRG